MGVVLNDREDIPIPQVARFQERLENRPGQTVADHPRAHVDARLGPFEIETVIPVAVSLSVGEMPHLHILLPEQCHIDGSAAVELEHGEPETDSELQ